MGLPSASEKLTIRAVKKRSATALSLRAIAAVGKIKIDFSLEGKGEVLVTLTPLEAGARKDTLYPPAMLPPADDDRIVLPQDAGLGMAVSDGRLPKGDYSQENSSCVRDISFHCAERRAADRQAYPPTIGYTAACSNCAANSCRREAMSSPITSSSSSAPTRSPRTWRG
jgi:hypothetical protein